MPLWCVSITIFVIGIVLLSWLLIIGENHLINLSFDASSWVFNIFLLLTNPASAYVRGNFSFKKKLTIAAPQTPSRPTQYHIANCMSSHQTQGYFRTPTQLSLSNHIMSADIGGMVFFKVAARGWWNRAIFWQRMISGVRWWIYGRCDPVHHQEDRRSQRSCYFWQSCWSTKRWRVSRSNCREGTRCSPIIIHIYFISSIDSEIRLFPKI